MEKTFTLKRQEIICSAQMIIDVQESCTALFDVMEINAEFKRITTMPLQSRFVSQLDLHSRNLLRVFVKRSGQQGKKLKDLADSLTDDGDAGREIVIKGLCMYLNEDPEDLVQEYTDTTEANSMSAIKGTSVGIYVARLPVVPTLMWE